MTMKKIIFSLALLFAATCVQAQAHDGSVEYQKSQQPAAVIELPYNPDVVKAALNEYLSKKGKAKGSDLKGFVTYRNTQPLQSDSANADLFFKVERKSRQDKEVSVVSLLLAMPSQGMVSNVRYLNMEEAKTYLNELAPTIESYNLELLVKDQNERVIKAENKYKDLVQNQADLEKKRADTEKKIQENQADMKTQMAEVEAQKQKLTALVSQRKS